MKKYFYILFLFGFFSCDKKISDMEAKEISNKALNLSINNNKDSLIKAVEIIDKIIIQYPKNQNYVGSKINFLCKLGRYDEAYNELQKLKTKIEEDYNFFILEGLILERLKRQEKSTYCFKQGLTYINKKLEGDPKNNSLIIEKYTLISILSSKESALKQFDDYIKKSNNSNATEIKNILINFNKNEILP